MFGLDHKDKFDSDHDDKKGTKEGKKVRENVAKLKGFFPSAARKIDFHRFGIH